MEKMRVLLANEPRVYREVIADALKKLRPLIEVSACEPEDLDHEVSRLRPHLVICSEASSAVRDGSLVWILLYPDGEDEVEIGGAGLGEGATPPPIAKVADLLAVVDETVLSLAPPPEAEESPAEG
ncbi:MAG: hypothetical protein ACRDSJ_24270 [Rubrobacteraceae bacterium]